MSLIDVTRNLTTDEQCLEFLERVRWPNGVRCPVCGNDKISRVTRQSPGKNKRTALYTCLEQSCLTQFSATSGTMFHDSHLPLHKWFMAVALMVDAKKGMRANQMKRHLQVSYRTAWYLAHRIRKAMEDGSGPLLSGTVEIDETYIGGRHRGHGKGPHTGNKQVVVGIRQRGGGLRLRHAHEVTSETLGQFIRENVSPDVDTVVTDEFGIYPLAMIKAGVHGSKHKTIRHKDHVYVEGPVYTNTVESAFSLFKRGIVGSFHKVSAKHLHRYLSEFEYRFDRRNVADLFRATVTRLSQPGNMEYKQLIAD